ncbi:MAG: tRNA lysidine(34) synthetase TilS [Nitrospinae bacterium]|nr:tRNA lysidine(34) synthetase TilS [Nitrospinota bacterium]
MILQKIRGAIRRHAMLSPGERVCVAVSGGPDSTALLLLLHDLKDELGVTLSVCHVNHRLRGYASDEDERFVKELAGRLSLPCETAAVDVTKYAALTGSGVQAAARELRYGAFRTLAAHLKADKVATAHTADDSAETLLINLLRGAGPQGLSGIPPVREGFFIRPLIETRKEELLRWLKQKGQPWRTDASNAEAKYARNRVRQSLLPIMEKEFNPSAREALARAAEILGDTHDFIRHEAEKSYDALFSPSEDGVVADRAAFALLHPALQRELVRTAVLRVRKTLAGISFAHFEEIRHLALSGIGGEITLKGLTVGTAHGKLYFSPTPFTAVQQFSYPLKVPGTTDIPEANCTVTGEMADAPPAQFDPHCEAVYLDAAAIPPTAVLRNRRDGDHFHPLGAPGGRKLKRFFIDEKVPRWERDRIVLLADGNEVLWVAGQRVSEKVKITPATNCILCVKLIRPPV